MKSTLKGILLTNTFPGMKNMMDRPQFIVQGKGLKTWREIGCMRKKAEMDGGLFLKGKPKSNLN